MLSLLLMDCRTAITYMTLICRAVDGLMKDLPLKKLRNFGGKLGAELGEMNCTTAGEVAALPHKALVAKFGEERATFIARAVRGYSDEPVQACSRSSTITLIAWYYALIMPATLIGYHIFQCMKVYVAMLRSFIGPTLACLTLEVASRLAGSCCQDHSLC